MKILNITRVISLNDSFGFGIETIVGTFVAVHTINGYRVIDPDGNESTVHHNGERIIRISGLCPRAEDVLTAVEDAVEIMARNSHLISETHAAKLSASRTHRSV